MPISVISGEVCFGATSEDASSIDASKAELGPDVGGLLFNYPITNSPNYQILFCPFLSYNYHMSRKPKGWPSSAERGRGRPIPATLKRKNKTYCQALGSTVTRLRIEKAWAQHHLAENTGYSTYYINCLEQGKRNPSLEVIQAISEVFDLRPSQLLALGERNQTKR